jgi:hypothetical protein
MRSGKNFNISNFMIHFRTLVNIIKENKAAVSLQYQITLKGGKE